MKETKYEWETGNPCARLVSVEEEWEEGSNQCQILCSQILSIGHCKYSCGALVVHPLPPLCIHAH